MNSFIATFYTHYGAMKFDKICKKFQVLSKLAPVPRKLSSSCGTCVTFSSESCAFVFECKDVEDMEKCYLVTGNEFKEVLKSSTQAGIF